MKMKYSFLGILSVLALVGAGCTQSVSINSTTSVNSQKQVDRQEVLGVGSRVFAEWKDNTWYHGNVDATCESGFNVTFDDGNQKCLATSQILLEKHMSASDVKVGTKVIAKWTGIAYFDAEVIKVNSEDSYTVKYYDKMERDVHLAELIPDTRSEVRGDESKKGEKVVGNFKVGDKVVAEWTSANALYTAEVIGSCEKGLNVRYYDDAEKCLAENQVLPDVAPTNKLEVGTKVLVRDSNTNNFFVGEIDRVDGEGYGVTYNAYGSQETKDFAPENVRVDSR